MTGNSLAHLLCQEQKSATADVRVVHPLKVMTGNSLAHLLCQEQKSATTDIRVVSIRKPDIRRPQDQFRSAA
jgi:hypothetical protein